MHYVKYRLMIHAVAFLLGSFYFHWSLLGLLIFAHYFIAPAQVAQIRRVHDIDDFKRNGDREGLKVFARTVNILTFQSSLISGLWYLVGLGVGILF